MATIKITTLKCIRRQDLSGDDEKALKVAIEDWKKNGSF